MSRSLVRLAASLTAPALAFGGIAVGTAAQTTTAFAAQGQCTAATGTVTIFGYNDFHGRVEAAAKLFTPVEEARATQGEDNVLLISSGDNIGASTFVSLSANDEPTLDVMATAGVESVTVGNHEFDKGWADLKNRVVPDANIPYLGANVYTKGTTTVADPLKEYQLFTKGGVTIAVVGAVTKDIPSLVSPAGIAELTIGDPVEAINRVAKQLSDGDTANGEADIVVASIHEGAASTSSTAEANAAASTSFASIYSGLDTSVDVVLNGHTHQLYNWKTTGGVPLLQAASYGTDLAKVELSVDATNHGLCSTTASVVKPAATAGTQARIVAIQDIVTAAVAESKVIGAEVIGYANKAISTAVDGSANNRGFESPMTNLVAQMFYDQLSNGNIEFIGIQNPGGTRDSFDKGVITYQEANLVLPFANSLMTTQVTGAQFKKVLEQQWQRDAKGAVPSRAYLALGLSKNVSYTFDESRAEGDRITGVFVNGAPIVADKLYTVGSGSYLISGGDNFWELGKGVNTTDTGRADLEAWVEWVKAQDALNPDYTKRGVSVTGGATTLTEAAAPVTFTLGQPLAGGVQTDTLDMKLNATGTKVSPQLKNTTVNAFIGDVNVGSSTVTDGVATVAVQIPAGTTLAAGATTLRFEVAASGTVVRVPVTVALAPKASPSPWPSPSASPSPAVPGPINVYTTPGIHHVNGRVWMTACEPYSFTARCWTYIWASQVRYVNGTYVKSNGWAFNSLTYLPAYKAQWGTNPLANAGEWTGTDGRKWKTECGTPATGSNACRSYAMATVIEATQTATGYTYKPVTKWVFNNAVLFK